MSGFYTPSVSGLYTPSVSGLYTPFVSGLYTPSVCPLYAVCLAALRRLSGLSVGWTSIGFSTRPGPDPLLQLLEVCTTYLEVNTPVRLRSHLSHVALRISIQVFCRDSGLRASSVMERLIPLIATSVDTRGRVFCD